jgi:hypothetical protein
LNLVDHGYLVVFFERSGFDGATDEIRIFEFFLLSGDERAIAELLLVLPSEEPERGHVDS